MTPTFTRVESYREQLDRKKRELGFSPSAKATTIISNGTPTTFAQAWRARSVGEKLPTMLDCLSQTVTGILGNVEDTVRQDALLSQTFDEFRSAVTAATSKARVPEADAATKSERLVKYRARMAAFLGRR